MNRRRFLETAALAPVAMQSVGPQMQAAPSPAGRMKCGTQHNSTDEVLTICARARRKSCLQHSPLAEVRCRVERRRAHQTARARRIPWHRS